MATSTPSCRRTRSTLAGRLLGMAMVSRATLLFVVGVCCCRRRCSRGASRWPLHDDRSTAASSLGAEPAAARSDWGWVACLLRVVSVATHTHTHDNTKGKYKATEKKCAEGEGSTTNKEGGKEGKKPLSSPCDCCCRLVGLRLCLGVAGAGAVVFVSVVVFVCLRVCRFVRSFVFVR